MTGKLAALNVFIGILLLYLTAILDSTEAAKDYNRNLSRGPGRDYSDAARDYERNRTRAPARGLHVQRIHPCEQGSCYPATGNLLIGRRKQLHASSTCGLNGPERYCIVSHLKDRKKCFFCDASNPRQQHNIENIVSGTPHRTWWQAENGMENVTITFDLEAEFHFTHIIIHFQTFRPAAMLIERSYDFGNTWQVYRYFAHDCKGSFPGVPTHQPTKLTDVICDSRYSNVEPSADGEIIFRVLPSNLPIENPYSKEVQNLLKMTNFRINFTRLHTLGDDLLDNRREIREKYYYAIKEMVIRGSCSCYGHASHCLPLDGVDNEEDMVHGRCNCTHNTKGRNCEKCEDFFNDLPWKPAVGKQTNACRMCNCNGHSTSCHFDEAVYERSGRVSGGVCDDCQHNTRGQNCELCKPFFYHDSSKDITDPEACQPCDCDPRGSLDEGICDSRTDPLSGDESGRCHCKANVEGRRCDRCQNGFWNFTDLNPEGCQACTCNTQGTINNQGCNMVTGECTCKRYVVGRDCNQCLPEYWGLSDDQEGCKPCDCDLGGAYNNSCDAYTGQCHCRPHVSGRSCNVPEQNYYTGWIDYLIYEGEYAKGTDNCQVVIREPYRDGRNNSWTGLGFMSAIEDSVLNFTVDGVRRSMWYDIVVRYEPKYSGTWDDAEIIIERDGPPNSEGPCGKWQPEEDRLWVQLPTNQRSSVASPPVCLEAGKVYTVLLQLRKFARPPDAPTASILIDSIVLSPRLENIPFFTGGPGEIRLQEYERFRCQDYFNNIYEYYSIYENRSDIRDICTKYQNSIGLYVFDGAHSCECNPTGSHSLICSNYGGNCQCKPNVVGRSCDHCAPGTYGFGPEGCVPCDCDGVGALDNFCDAETGRCKCRPNTYGRSCGQCEPGFWNFPHCRRCECNGHADSCDSKTGACQSCRDSTTGHNCDRCIEAFYGDPRIGVDIPCRPCPCPGTLESGHAYADSCSLDPVSHDVICECYQGYAGPRCDTCADNFYGNPETPGGKCQSCECSNNTDLNRPGNCDPQTGKCLQCLWNTDGFNCQVCKADFYGDALQQNCQSCQCNILGTDAKAGPCDHRTGQCPCLPHVIGQLCDTCEENHWRIASGEGCDPCECDVVGSVSDRCNPYEGTCECKPGFGGRRCNECQANYWGNPNVQCYPCECDVIGSASAQCDRETGVCVCHEGIGGEKCDQCDRSYIGTAPSCSPCGECFDNWDGILDGLRNKTLYVIDEASNIQKVGTTGIYSQEFEDIDNSIAQINTMLESSSVKSQDLDELNQLATNLDKDIDNSATILQDLENQLENVTQRVTLADAQLKRFKNRTDALHEGAAELRENANRLQEANVQGALNVTQQMADQSRLAEKMAAETNNVLLDAERYKKNTENLLAKSSANVEENRQKNKDSLERLNEKLDTLKSHMPQLNQDMCGRNVTDCDSVCGGAGCGHCGGLSCDVGAMTKAMQALDVAKKQSTMIKEHKDEAEQLLRNLIRLKDNASGARSNAQEAFDLASAARNQSDKLTKDLSNVNKKIWDLLKAEQPTPAEVRDLAKEVLNEKITLTPEEIKGLADKIANIVGSLNNPELILRETSDDLQLAKELRERANYTKKIAQEKEALAGKVVELLMETQGSQEIAQEAISKAEADIDLSKHDLDEISQITKQAKQKADDTTNSVNDLENRLLQLQAESVKNDFVIKQEIQAQASNISEEARRVQANAKKLSQEYKSVELSLNQRVDKSKDDIGRAKGLLKRASELTADTVDKFKDIEGMESVYKDNDRLLRDLMEEVDHLNALMNQHLAEFESKAQQLRQC
ncbi:laminin subunit beta-1 [Nasonia vitripennis]|uniref:Laminin subunit beta-2 n=1 Tax=Nasonia vitripennis TaxID=7425 RepID=A0A7M7H7N2_NASVI|nr:laminin subunit beta-1 [Nasonia vitripennis]XP_008203086.1 laminin subunit beta-1 [Nasonia vitripennis]XP_031777813.1 laminin subunit beta-1 [Nasonia vitripennis]